jgi:hypothetical protein
MRKVGWSSKIRATLIVATVIANAQERERNVEICDSLGRIDGAALPHCLLITHHA